MKIDSQQFHDLQELHCFAADASLEVHRKRIMELWAMDTPQGRSGFRWMYMDLDGLTMGYSGKGSTYLV